MHATTTGPRRLQNRFQAGGWTTAWHALYLVTLTAATIAAVTDGAIDVGERVGMAALALSGASWYLLITVRWQYWRAPPVRYALLLSVAAALWIPLVRWHPAFGWTVFAAYGVAACPWLRRAAPSVGILTALLAIVDHSDGTALTGGELAGLVLVGVAVLVVHAGFAAVHRESERRRSLITELETTRADLADREHRAGVLEERQRLARDIHDGLAQGFASIVTLLEVADTRLPAQAVDARAAIDQARQAARDSLGEARRLVWALRPGDEGSPGALLAALDRLAERTLAAGRARVEVVTTGDPQAIDPASELTLLRTAQEAVANAARHAQASSITITISWLGDQVILDVADDGIGFDPDQLPDRPADGSGFGLIGLRERAAAAGAALDIDTVVGEGTTISLSVPTEAPVSRRSTVAAGDEPPR